MPDTVFRSQSGCRARRHASAPRHAGIPQFCRAPPLQPHTECHATLCLCAGPTARRRPPPPFPGQPSPLSAPPQFYLCRASRMKLPSGATPASRLREVRADGDVVAAAEKLEKVRTHGSGSKTARAYARAAMSGPALAVLAVQGPVMCMQLVGPSHCLRLHLRCVAMPPFRQPEHLRWPCRRAALRCTLPSPRGRTSCSRACCLPAAPWMPGTMQTIRRSTLQQVQPITGTAAPLPGYRSTCRELIWCCTALPAVGDLVIGQQAGCSQSGSSLRTDGAQAP